ncbi:MAG: hypothetical protein FK734_04465 [Asgard group archaeon]|nr:hypothetical protein [Asgard group archaeon]
MTVEQEMKISENRVTEGIKSYRFEQIGILSYILHYILNIAIIGIGVSRPNPVLYQPTYLENLSANYLYPWIVLSNESFSIASLVLGIAAILAEIVAIVFIVFRFQKEGTKKHNLFEIIMKAMLVVIAVGKYLSLYITSYLYLEKGHYEYPDNIYWSFVGGTGFATYFSIFLIFFILQAVIITLIIAGNYRLLAKESSIVPKPTNNLMVPLLTILSIILAGKHQITIKNQGFWQTIFDTNNVTAPLENGYNYLTVITFCMIASAVMVVLFIIYWAILQLLIKRSK